jgi:hypothetical protein
MTTKVCSNCGEEKDISEFYKRSDSNDGYRVNLEILLIFIKEKYY